MAKLDKAMIALQKPAITVRRAVLADVPRLVVMNHAAYPELVEANVVWNEAQLQEHIARFPEGQLVAEMGGKPMGAISTFIVARGRDPLAQHSWLEITENGSFAGHDAGGDTLYLADIYVDPAGWGKGVGERLYACLLYTSLAGPTASGRDPETGISWSCGPGGCSYELPRTSDPACTGATCRASCPAPDIALAKMKDELVCVE